MHKIGDISFQVEIQENKTQVSYEKQYAEFLKNQLLPKVEVVFDKWSIAYPKLKCTIEEIEIEIKQEEFKAEELQKKLLQQIIKQLAKVNVQNPELSKDIKVAISLKPSIFKAFIQYIETGILPNYVTVKQIKEWLKKEQEYTEKQTAQIKKIVKKDNKALQRITNVYKEKTHKEILKKILKTTIEINQETFLKKLINKIQENLKITIAEKEKKEWIKTLIKTKKIKEIAETIEKKIKEKVNIKALSQTEKEQLQIRIVQAILQYESTKQIEENITEDIKIQIIKKSKTEIEEEKEIRATDKKNNKITKEEKEQKEQKNKKTTKEKETKQNKQERNEKKEKIKRIEKQKQQEKEIKITTEKAGIILIHPFIKELFKRMGVLTENKEIKNTNKAAVILHYIATGNEEAMDIEMSLEKIILGIPQAEILTKPQKLTEKEKQQCDELLVAVIQHWKIYKSKAITTLRAMFIQRYATIEKTETKIKIEVEKQAQDILLDKLPWGIEMIKLPWLKQIIYTKW